jgi:membrane-bound serine protease (ClpP class)
MAGGADLPETLLRKATEDMSALARSLADRRGEDALEWADRAVREAESVRAAEALELGLIDLVADDTAELLSELDGQSVEVDGDDVEIDTDEAVVEDVEMTTGEGILSRLIHPAVALLLITIGVNAILIELSSPGGFVAGVIGVLALVLGFYSLGVLEANMIGLVFIAAAFVLFVLELKSPTHGLLAGGGILLFIVGAMVLFSSGVHGVPWGTVFALAFGTGLFVMFAVGAIVKAMRRQPTTGVEGMIGQRAVVLEELAPVGTVLLQGELWKAREEGDATVPVDSQVRVMEFDGYILVVNLE